MRARRRKWTNKEVETNEKILLSPQDFKGKWKDYFGNDNPLYVEIGCGKGRFIFENAKISRDVNFLALEREMEVIVVGARKARIEPDLNNIAFAACDAQGFLDIFAPGEIDRIYINFCDPWPNRKKWRKRRLTHRGFLEMYKNILAPNGEIFFKTDNSQLFEFSINEFLETGWKLKNVTLDLHKSEFTGNIMTEYEERFFNLGMPIYRLEAAKSEA